MRNLKSLNEFEKVEESSKVDQHYDKIIEEIKKAARKLNDDEAYELHEKLKKFFERAF